MDSLLQMALEAASSYEGSSADSGLGLIQFAEFGFLPDVIDSPIRPSSYKKKWRKRARDDTG